MLVLAVVGVTFAFGLGQPALMEAVGDAVADDVRGVALGIATLFFLVGGGVGSAVVGGLGDVLGMPPALLMLAALPVFGLLALLPRLRGPAEHPYRSTRFRPACRMSRWVSETAGPGCVVLHGVRPRLPRNHAQDKQDQQDRSSRSLPGPGHG